MTPQPEDHRRVVAYQLSLLGEEPRPACGWRPTFYAWSFAGCPVPPDDEAIRQARLMRRETLGGVS